mmetsp:Transcript_74426/g.164388  ORF Transcript_74426/g.164388 Transcript_74426/m.164388 type:complete len:237 (-) Transcript_74426:27-737(-)
MILRRGGAGEMVSHPVFDRLAPEMKSFCFAEEDGESFAPEGMGTVLFTKRKLADALPFFKSVKTKNPLDRLAYHLFNAQGFQREYDGSAIFDPSLFVGALFRKSLGNITVPHMPADDGPATYCASEGEMCRCSGRVYFGRKFDNDQALNGQVPKSPADDGPATICANEGEMCECQGKAYYGRKLPVNGKEPLNLAQTVTSVYRAKMVRGQIRCSPGGFGGDPLVGVSKHCLCQPHK